MIRIPNTVPRIIAVIILCTIIVGGARQSHFDQFIEELFGCDFGQPLVESQGFDNTYIILDNAPCHRGVESRLSETIPQTSSWSDFHHIHVN